MKKSLAALLAVSTIAITLLASATDADAQRRWRRGGGGGVAAGVAAGLVGAAIIGAATAPRYGYAEPVYVAPRRTCLVDRQRWSNRMQAYVIERVRVPC